MEHVGRVLEMMAAESQLLLVMFSCTSTVLPMYSILKCVLDFVMFFNVNHIRKLKEHISCNILPPLSTCGLIFPH